MPTFFIEWQGQGGNTHNIQKCFSLFFSFWEMALSMDLAQDTFRVHNFPCTPYVIPVILCRKLRKRKDDFCSMTLVAILRLERETLNRNYNTYSIPFLHMNKQYCKIKHQILVVPSPFSHVKGCPSGRVLHFLFLFFIWILNFITLEWNSYEKNGTPTYWIQNLLWNMFLSYFYIFANLFVWGVSM